MATPSEPIEPRGITRRGWIVVVVIGALVIAAYALVAVLYSAEGDTSSTNGPLPANERGIIATVTPVTVEPVQAQTTVDLAFVPQGDLADDAGRLTKNVRIAVSSSTGTQELKLTAGDSLSRMEVHIGMTGDEVQYPFDSHDAVFLIQADIFERDTGGAFTSVGNVPVGLQGSSGVAGWDTVYAFPPRFSDGASGSITYSRAFTTKAFAFVLLFLVISLSVLALIIGILVFTNRRKAEVALLSWTAALLFALPLLRTYMPGSPPIGAAIDIYIYLWVIVMAVIATVLSAIAWIRQNAVRRAS